MKKLLTLLTAAGALFAFQLHAEEVEVKGTATCGKCDLGEYSSCQNVLLKDDKTIELTGPVSKQFHRNVCKGSAEVTVKGEMAEDGKSIEVTEIAKVD